jgi:acyl-CoA synthetase (NDP forming)
MTAYRNPTKVNDEQNELELSSLFSPYSVAVVGASERLGSLGSTALLNSIEAGFRGRL